VNHHQIPVNQPKGVKGGYNSYHRDGQMRVDGNQGAALHYEPNSYGMWQEQPEHDEPVQKVDGNIKRWNFREDDDNYYEQPGKLFRLMNQDEQQRLFDNTARNMGCSDEIIKIRHIGNCYKADPAYGRGVADALGISYEKAGII
jgi:catalase